MSVISRWWDRDAPHHCPLPNQKNGGHIAEKFFFVWLTCIVLQGLIYFHIMQCFSQGKHFTPSLTSNSKVIGVMIVKELRNGAWTKIFICRNKQKRVWNPFLT